jgi:hypothetical protein
MEAVMTRDDAAEVRVGAGGRARRGAARWWGPQRRRVVGTARGRGRGGGGGAACALRAAAPRARFAARNTQLAPRRGVGAGRHTREQNSSGSGAHFFTNFCLLGPGKEADVARTWHATAGMPHRPHRAQAACARVSRRVLNQRHTYIINTARCHAAAGGAPRRIA